VNPARYGAAAYRALANSVNVHICLIEPVEAEAGGLVSVEVGSRRHQGLIQTLGRAG